MDIKSERKRLIDRFKGIEDARLIRTINDLLDLAMKDHSKKQLSDVFGVLSSSEADELHSIIEDGCENIDLDGWK